MAETGVLFINSLSPFPDYALSSTGSLRLSGLQEPCPSTVVAFEDTHRRKPAPTSLRQRIVGGMSKEWSKMTFARLTKRHLPIVKTMRHYNVSRDLLSDVVAGVTVGVMMIPQAMAFALVATLPPIVGLYMAFFSSLVYVVLGSSRHLSWNCVAVLAIMMGNLLNTYDTHLRQTLIHDQHHLHPNLTQHDLTLLYPPSSTVLSHSDPAAEDLSATTQYAASAHQRGDAISSNDAVTIAGHKQVLGASSALPPEDLTDITSNQSPGVESSTTSAPRTSTLEKMITSKKIELACSVTLMSGIILAVLGKLGLGRLASFMSDSLVISFTVGVTFHVAVDQAGNALGLQLPARTGVFKIFMACADIATHVRHTNFITAAIFFLCASTIYIVKRFINEKYAGKLKVPIPVELIVVIVATVVSTSLKMDETYSVAIVEEISSGIPEPKVPDLSVGLNYLSEGLIIIFVSFTQTVALGKIMALKHNYRIDSNLEMFSLGAASVVCSFFSGFIPGASITCTVIQDSAGGRTQIATLFSSGLVLLVLMFLGPYFHYLPRCVLAAIVLINIRTMFLKLLTVPALWRKSRGDAVVWVSTCVATVVLDTDLGLFVGMAVCVCGVLVRSRISPVSVLGQVLMDKHQVWRSVDKYHNAQELPGVKVVGIKSDFYFVNADLVTDQIVKMSGINPSKLKRKGVVLHVKESAPVKTANHHIIPDLCQHTDMLNTDRRSVDEKSVILDCELIQDIRVDGNGMTQNDGEVMEFDNPPLTKENGHLLVPDDHHHSSEDSDHLLSSTDSIESIKGKEHLLNLDDNHHSNKDDDHLLPPDNKHSSTKDKGQLKSSDSCRTTKDTTPIVLTGDHRLPPSPLTTLIIDFGAVSYMDLMAVEALDILVGEFEAVGVDVLLTQLQERCVSKLRATGFLEKHCDKVFVTTAAALNYV